MDSQYLTVSIIDRQVPGLILGSSLSTVNTVQAKLALSPCGEGL